MTAILSLLANTGVDLRRMPTLRSVRVARDQALYNTGTCSQHALYLVRFGAFKTTRIDFDGSVRVTGFQMQQEVLGLEALGMQVYRSSAIALEDSGVWELPFRQLPHLHLALHELLSDAATNARNVAMLLRSSDAEQRIAAFLLNISSRYGAAGYSSRCFRLPMARVDVGEFLGLTAESVSRCLSRLQMAGIIEVDRRFITLCDRTRLVSIASRERAVIDYAGGRESFVAA